LPHYQSPQSIQRMKMMMPFASCSRQCGMQMRNTWLRLHPLMKLTVTQKSFNALIGNCGIKFETNWECPLEQM